jgi:hypothetical protein
MPNLETAIRDALIAPLWLVATLLLIGSSLKVGDRLFGRRDPAKLVQTTVVLVWGQILILCIGLSLISSLTGPMLLVSGAISSMVVLIALRRRRGVPDEGAIGIRAEEDASFFGSIRRRGVWPFAWGLVIAYLIVRVILHGLLEFPDEYDTLAYHIPLIDQWLQARSLFAPDGPEWTYPGNNEVLGLWMVAPFSGDFLVGMNNLAAIVLLAASSVRLGSHLRLPRSVIHPTAMLICLNIVVRLQAVECRNDVAVAALGIAFLDYILDHFERPNPWNLGLAGLCLGLLGGVKYYALGHAAVLGALALGGTMVLLGPARWLRILAGLTPGVMLGSGYWYARNAFSTGSPLYPLGVLGREGDLYRISPTIWSSTIIWNGSPEIPALMVQAVWRWAGPGHLVALLALPLTACWLAASGVRRCREDARGGGIARILLAGSAIATFFVVLVTPLLVEDVPGTLNQIERGQTLVRYGLIFFSLGFYALVVAVHDLVAARRGGWVAAGTLGAGPPRILVALLAILIGWEVFRIVSATAPVTGLDDAIEVLVALVVWLVAVVAMSGRVRSGLVALRRPARALSLGAACLLAFGLSFTWHAGFARNYGPYIGDGVLAALEKAGARTGTVCVLEPKCYPYFGSGRERRILRPIWIPSFESFVDLLDSRGASLVVISEDGGNDGRYAGLFRRVRAHPQFMEVANKRNILIFKYNNYSSFSGRNALEARAFRIRPPNHSTSGNDRLPGAAGCSESSAFTEIRPVTNRPPGVL